MDLLVNIDVSDLQRAIAFYTAAFGLRVGRRFGQSGVELVGSSAPIYLLMKAEGTLPASEATGPRSYARHWTPVHLDFVVADLEAAIRAAERAGGRLEKSPSTSSWGKLALLSDPFGNGFCLIQFLGRGYDEIAD